MSRRWTKKKRAFWITLGAMGVAGLLYLWLPYRVAMVQAFFWLGGSRLMIRAEYHALEEPKYQSIQEADRYRPEIEVVGLELPGVAKAIPLKRLAWHLVLNDRLGGESVVVTYCTVTEAVVVYRAECQGRTLHFDPARLARNNLVIRDRETGSDWQQFTGQAIEGPLTGARLTPLLAERVSLADWHRQHPDSLILEPSGEQDDCCAPNDDCPVMRYFPTEPFLLQRPTQEDPRLPRKEMVVGTLAESGEAMAFPARAGKVDRNEEVPGGLRCYWFAWVEFHPETRLLPSLDLTTQEDSSDSSKLTGR